MSILSSYEKVIIRMGHLACDMDDEIEEAELEWGAEVELKTLLSDLHDIKRIMESWGNRLEDVIDDAELARLAHRAERRSRTWVIEDCPRCDQPHDIETTCMEYAEERAEYMEER